MVYTRGQAWEVTSARSSSVRLPVMFQSGLVLSPGPVTGSLLVTETIWQTGLASQLSDATAVSVTGTRWWLAGARLSVSAVNELMVGAVRSTTLSRTVQRVALPASSVTQTCTSAWPRPSKVPAAGSCRMTSALAGVQLSLAAIKADTSGTAAWQSVPTLRLMGSGQLTAGGVTSTTVNVVLQTARLPAASVTVTVISCVPQPTAVPGAGLCSLTRSPVAVQLSAATTSARKSGRSTWPWASAAALLAPGHCTVGDRESRTVTATVSSAEAPLESVTRNVRVWA